MVTFQVGVAAMAPLLGPRCPSADWSLGSPPLRLSWDVAHKSPAAEPTAVYVSTDSRFPYVRFDASQRTGIAATQHSNGQLISGSVGTNGNLAWSSDDAVWVDLWSTGPGGFEYQFEANAGGAHNESSTGNAGFGPQWESQGAVVDGGYTVTMANPLGLIHGAHGGASRAQFVRYVRRTGASYVWTDSPSQAQPDDPGHADTVIMPTLPTYAAYRAKPRLVAYGLAALAGAPAGRNTTRVGADVSYPVTPTAALYGTFHPDYSNVEIDQTTIASNLFARSYVQTRPFFTQAASYYNNFPCAACPVSRQLLYIPGIPTPSQGYALEGKQRAFGFATLDAIGDARNDAAAALNDTSEDNHWQASLQHIQANLPGIIDNANEIGVNWRDGKYLSANVDYATEGGTNVLVPAQAKALDGGANFISQDLAPLAGFRSIGPYFNPVDGYNGHPDIAGFSLYTARQWQFAPQDKLLLIAINGATHRYQGVAYRQSQNDNWLDVDILTKSLWDLQMLTGSDYWRFGTLLEPVSQAAGSRLTYHSGLANNLQNYFAPGASSYPTQIQLYAGQYGTGFLDTWFRTSTVRVGDRGALNLTFDGMQKYMSSGPSNTQCFEGFAYAYQISPNASLAAGARRVSGYPPVPRRRQLRGQLQNI